MPHSTRPESISLRQKRTPTSTLAWKLPEQRRKLVSGQENERGQALKWLTGRSHEEKSFLRRP